MAFMREIERKHKSDIIDGVIGEDSKCYALARDPYSNYLLDQPIAYYTIPDNPDMVQLQ